MRVHILKGKQLELSASNSVHIYSMAFARYALTQRSKGQRSRSHSYKNLCVHVAAVKCAVAVVCYCYWRETAHHLTAKVSSCYICPTLKLSPSIVRD